MVSALYRAGKLSYHKKINNNQASRTRRKGIRSWNLTTWCTDTDPFALTRIGK